MAEPQRAGATAARAILSVVAVATTLGGALAMTVNDTPATSLSPAQLDSPSLPPLPTLEPTADAPPVRARRPVPVATTRSSR